MKPRILNDNPINHNGKFCVVLEEIKSVLISNLTEQQAKRALSLFLDSPIDWDSVNKYADSSPLNYEIVIDRICVQCCIEFEMKIEDILIEDTEYGARKIRERVVMQPKFGTHNA
jgi:hypothetical protein